MSYRGEILRTCSVSFGCISGPGEGYSGYELGETEVSLRDTQFLGLAGYYKRFSEDFSRLAVPMKKLTRKKVKFEWNDLCERAFQELKRRLILAAILIVSERGQMYTVYCDASKDRLGCVLM